MSNQIGVTMSEVSQHTSTLRASANSSSSEGSAFQSRASGSLSPASGGAVATAAQFNSVVLDAVSAVTATIASLSAFMSNAATQVAGLDTSGESDIAELGGGFS
jgi:hypothetical protein